jgi:predicted oxidoreductase
MLGDSFMGDAAKVSTGTTSSLLAHNALQTLVQMAFENGINTFDTAETYANGKSELELYAKSSYRTNTLPDFNLKKGTRYQGTRLQAHRSCYYDQDILGNS